jgi:hypothetical protein
MEIAVNFGQPNAGPCVKGVSASCALVGKDQQFDVANSGCGMLARWEGWVFYVRRKEEKMQLVVAVGRN